MKKIRVAVDIDEVLRAKWVQFDRYYAQEFGEEGIPEQPYVFDYFENYEFLPVNRVVNVLNEPEDCPDISAIDYVADENGVAPADMFLFTKEKEVLTAKEVFNRFMYEDFCFEIFGTAPLMYRGLDFHFNQFHKKFNDRIELVVVSKENVHSIPSTFSFLSKMLCRASNVKFVEESKDKWKDVDVLITSDPCILNSSKPAFKKLIKIIRPFNVDIKTKGIEVMQLFDLVDNTEFHKMIGFSEKYFKEV